MREEWIQENQTMLGVRTKARWLCAYSILVGALIVSALVLALYAGRARTFVRTPPSSSVEHGPIVNAVAFSPRGETLAVAAGNSVLMLKNGSSQPFATVDHPEEVSTIAFSPDGKVLATASSTLIKLCDATTGQEQKQFKGYDAYRLAFSPDGKTMAVAGFVENPNILIRKLVNNSISLILTGYHIHISAIAFNKDGKHLISVGDDSHLKIWDVASRSVLKTMDSKLVFGAGIQCLAVHTDGKTFAAGCYDGNFGSVHFLDFDLNESGHIKTTQPVNAVAYSSDGVMLAVGCGEDHTRGGEVSLWRVADANQMAVLNGHTGPVQCLAFSPNGESLVTGSMDGSYKVRSMAPWYMAKVGSD